MLTFQAFSWHIGDQENIEQSSEFIVDVFGKTRSGESVCVHVSGFQPSFCIRVAPELCTEKNYSELIELLRGYLCVWKKDGDNFIKESDFPDELVDLEEAGIIEKVPFWGFSFGRKVPFFKLQFKTIRARSKILSLFRSCHKNKMDVEKMNDIYDSYSEIKRRDYDESKTFARTSADGYRTTENLLKWVIKLGNAGMDMGFASVKLYEVIDPILRFAHERNIQMAGWISIENGCIPIPRVTSCAIEVSTTYENVNSVIDDAICTKIKEMAFDIEAYSHDDRFPDPKDPQNYAYQIGVTLKNYSDLNYRRIVLHCRTPSHLRGENSGYCGDIVDCEVMNFETEADLLIAFAKLIVVEDPDLIYGYNSDSFDWNYLFERAEVCNVSAEFSEI